MQKIRDATGSVAFTIASVGLCYFIQTHAPGAEKESAIGWALAYAAGPLLGIFLYWFAGACDRAAQAEIEYNRDRDYRFALGLGLSPEEYPEELKPKWARSKKDA